MKRTLRIMLVVLVLSVVGALSISCGAGSDVAVVTQEQLATVQRGDLTIDITAVGNLAFSHREELAFEVSGTVSEILVEVGDFVEGGQALAKLDDTSTLSLQKAVVQAEINLESAEENLEEAQNPYTDLDIAQTEAVVVDVRIALEAAQEALEEAENPFTESDIVQAELAVINAEIALNMAEKNFERAEAQYKRNRSVPEWRRDYEQKQAQLAIAEFDLAEAEQSLADMKAGADPLEVEQKQKQLALAQATLKKSEDDLAEILGSVDSLEVKLKQSEVASAQATLDEAIERLEMATMATPFAGIITSINVEAGEAVNANQVVIELVDSGKFEADILVNETDIFNIRLGAEAIIQVDALSGISLPAKVTFFSPTATIQQGVVNYNVTVEMESFPAVMGEGLEARQEARQSISSGEFPERIRQAIEAGLISQQQAEEMMKRIQEGEMPLPPRGEQLPVMIPEDFRLREGLTVTVSIILEERNDVLLVPNAAITSSVGQAYVKVVSPDDVIEDRPVTIGISNWQYTEIVEGLSEGEKVIVPQGTTMEQALQEDPQGGIRIPGMGGFGR